MSKIIDALQEKFETLKTDKPALSEKDPTSSKSLKNHQITQQELADVYFGGSGSKTKELPTPTVIRVIDRKRSYLMPWIITTVALLLSSFALFSTKKIFIDVRIIDEAVLEQTSKRELLSAPGNPNSQLPLEAAVSTPGSSKFLSPLQFRFAGAAVLNSSRERNVLTLFNSSLSGIAYAAIEFKPPIDGVSRRLVFEARGKSGGENLELIFKDGDNNSSLNFKRITPFESGLSTHWQIVEIALEEATQFHASRVSQLRFEFGSQRTSNPPNTQLFIKNIHWVEVKAT